MCLARGRRGGYGSDVQRAMTEVQGNTPPPWKGRSTWSLCLAVVGGIRQNVDKLAQVVSILATLFQPSVSLDRLRRLAHQGHCDVVPTMSQLWVAARHQLSFSLGADTRAFYAAQGIPWTSHNLRRFVAYPTTMMDPIGLLSPRETIIHHVLQTFHRHATYDLVLLQAHEGGLASLQEQLDQLAEGTHLHQRSLDSLVEDGSYHDRLRHDVPEFAADPHLPARPIPEGLSEDPLLMLAMDQFKDLRGYTRYASRLRVGVIDVAVALARLAFNETLGGVFQYTIGPKTLVVEACEPELVARHLGATRGGPSL